MKHIKLFALNRRVRKFYITREHACCQRFSNNSEPKFTYIQAAVIYLYGLNLGLQKKITVYNFAKEHMLKYCEQLPSYKQFCLRINKLSPRSENIVRKDNGDKLGGLLQNEICIGVATDKQHTILLVEGTGKPSQKKTSEAFRHISKKVLHYFMMKKPLTEN